MKFFLSTGTALAAAIALCAAALPATAAPSAIAQVFETTTRTPSLNAIPVHSRSDRHRHHRRNRHNHVVDAPYAHVETGDRVEVDAPFAHVHVGRHGRHIVAPFVDLWLPR